jgi:hypothetical protein
MKAKVQTTKENRGKMDFIKIKVFGTAKVYYRERLKTIYKMKKMFENHISE